MSQQNPNPHRMSLSEYMAHPELQTQEEREAMQYCSNTATKYGIIGTIGGLIVGLAAAKKLGVRIAPWQKFAIPFLTTATCGYGGIVYSLKQCAAHVLELPASSRIGSEVREALRDFSPSERKPQTESTMEQVDFSRNVDQPKKE